MNDPTARIIEASFPEATIATVEQFDSGETHTVVSVEFTDREPVVLKYTNDGHGRLRRDTAALRYVAEQTDVPAPTVLDFGDGYLVIESLPGETTPQLRDFTADQASAYIETAGELVGRLHRDGQFESAGRLAGTPNGELQHDPADSWPSLYKSLKRETADELAGTRFEEAATKAVDALGELAEELTVDQPVLAHCDFGPNNVFRVGYDVSGVIDWEWCLAADPAYDLARAERLFRREANDGTRDALLAGYQQVRPVPDEYDWRAERYAAFETLSAMSSFESWRPDNDEQAQEIADTLRENLTDRLVE
jgi:Ser/Thr protein kinase RdoA (MazF antagonist)